MLLAFLLASPWSGLPGPFVAAFVFTRLNAPLEKEKSAIRAAVLMSILAAVISVIAVSVMEVQVGSDAEEVSGDFTVSIVATAMVNACIGAVFGGVAGFIAEITRSPNQSGPAEPPSRPPLDTAADRSAERDLRDYSKHD